jgi:hypothetical protein
MILAELNGATAVCTEAGTWRFVHAFQSALTTSGIDCAESCMGMKTKPEFSGRVRNPSSRQSNDTV